MVGKFESNKDLVQELTTSGAKRVGAIATLITQVVADVTREIGEFVTDVIEMREAAVAARRDAAEQERSSVQYSEFVDDDPEGDIDVAETAKADEDVLTVDDVIVAEKPDQIK
ncbi:hypothetical protein [Nocardia camponoti]|uniref:Uncharacterized protein n=1 Tax=Nocardia camponoti TaxID=1616106 RepID=A0A917QRG8_9NOCA|nr:hypothetical protein [Nocardia camponoti]GGK64731.1 hypothetical protein GCM10011591_41160 [Nocardia camponoti]